MVKLLLKDSLMTRTMLISSKKPPSGRALLLAKALSEVSTLSHQEAILLTYDIFNGINSPENPAIVTIKDNIDVRELRDICAECGIDVIAAA
jgi:hypothetical protein